MSQITKVIYNQRSYMVTWHSIKKTPMQIEIWRLSKSPTWTTIWASPKPMGPTAKAVTRMSFAAHARMEKSV